jgi:YVTN family beta-propeller protein
LTELGCRSLAWLGVFGAYACAGAPSSHTETEKNRDALVLPPDPELPLPITLPEVDDPLLAGLNVSVDAPSKGMWSTTQSWPINGLHAVLLPNGRVLTYGTPSGNAATQDGRTFDVWDPSQGFGGLSHRTTFNSQQVNSFCSSASFLSDGSLLVTGGNSPLESSVMSPSTGAVTTSPSRLADERWYGSMITLPDSRLLMLGGSTPYGALRGYQDPVAAINNGSISMTPEIFEPGTGFRSLFGAYSREAFGPDHHRYWYPRAWVAPNGEVFGISAEKMWYLNYSGNGSVRVAGDFKTGVNNTTRPNIGATSTAVMFAPGKILQVGGNGYHDGHATPSSALATVIDINGSTPTLTEVPAMSFPRQWASSVVLPDGRVVVTGGTRNANDGGSNAVYEAELWNPSSNAWTVGARAQQIRVYHSTALLLPNGTVLTAGGGAPGPVNNLNAEVYYPPYLFRSTPSGSAELSPRPELSAVSSLAFGYGDTLTAQLRSDATITRATLVASGSVTHSFDTSQRHLTLEMAQQGARVAAQMPTSALTAPPGYYTLFLIDDRGVPSSGLLLSLGDAVAAPPVSTLLPRGNHLTLRSVNFEGFALATDSAGLGVLADLATIDELRARFKVRDGLADSTCVSFESVLTPGQFLRQLANRVRLGTNDGTDTFKGDATFCPEAGLFGTGFSFRSKSFPTRMLRHRNFELWIDPVATDATFVADATFTLDTPLPNVPPVSAPIAAAGTSVSYAPQLSIAGAEYSWDFGDGSPVVTATSPAVTHVFAAPGMYLVTLTVQLADGRSVTETFVQAVRGELAAGTPRSSSAVAVDGAGRIWAVNPDTDTVSVFDGQALSRLREIAVGSSPRSVALAPDGRVWVTSRGSATLSVIDPVTFSVVTTVTLPRASRPHGLVFSPSGGQAYLTLEARGELLELNASTGATLRTLSTGPHPRGLAITADGARILMSRFVTPPLAGESGAQPEVDESTAAVLAVDLPSFTAARAIALGHSNRADGSVAGRGIPNYLAAPVISPDGQTAWLPSKQDNVQRGSFRDGLALDFQNTVRAITSVVDLTTENELIEARIDHDDSSVASAAAFHPSGVYLFVALETSREVAVVSALTGSELFRVDVGRAPQGVAVSADGQRLFVQNFMDRSLSVVDLSPLVSFGEFEALVIGTLPAVQIEKLASNVLLGKQLFYDARDPRLARDSYMSCASCHADGEQDGRVWDLTSAGEGVRNTISLVGRSGAQGLLHWSANFDEVQDFEGQIRALAGGTGLLSDADFLAGTRSQPLGDPKAGRSADLDALAAYLQSLSTVPPSPYRSATGLTPAATLGRGLFASKGCTACHYGATFSDEAGSGLKNIGTLTPASGQRLSSALLGIDTPTLRGAWASAPYLHDGSAHSIEEAIMAHASVTTTATELLNLAQFVREIDGGEPAVPHLACSDGLRNGLETGVDCGGNCPACPVCIPTSYEAESMYHSTGGAATGGWNIWANGYIATSHAFQAGTTTLTVRARGSIAANVWPNMRVSVGGIVLGNVTVNTTSYAPYTFTFVSASAQTLEVRVQFTNDYYLNGQDRNLFVDRVETSCSSAPPGPTCTDGTENGSETGVDCGGSCSTKCANGISCDVNADCQSGNCASGVCQPAPTCTDGVRNGTETGVDCGGSCAACPTCTPATYQAETMFHSTGGSATGGWNIWANGYISTPHNFTARTTITIYASGSVAQSVWPNMRVSVGGSVLGNVAVNTTSYAPYTFTFTPTTPGSAELRVEFTNDFYQQNVADRNLFVDRVELSCPN